LPHRASAGEPPTTHGGARRPDPGGCRLSPKTCCRAGHPGGRAGPRGPAGGQDEHLEDPRGRNVGPRGRGATENGQARNSMAMRRPRPMSDDRASIEGRPRNLLSHPPPHVLHPLPTHKLAGSPPPAVPRPMSNPRPSALRPSPSPSHSPLTRSPSHPPSHCPPPSPTLAPPVLTLECAHEKGHDKIQKTLHHHLRSTGETYENIICIRSYILETYGTYIGNISSMVYIIYPINVEYVVQYMSMKNNTNGYERYRTTLGTMGSIYNT
jgi:hypothetical protein